MLSSKQKRLVASLLLGCSLLTLSPALAGHNEFAPMRDVINIKDGPYPAVCNGNGHPLSNYFATLAAAQAVFPNAIALSDELDGTVIQYALNQTSPNPKAVYIPAGQCEFNEPLVVTGNNKNAYGDGPYQSVLDYDGSSTNIDLLTIGSSSSSAGNNSYRNFRVGSHTKMTAGRGIHVINITGSTFDGVTADGTLGTGNLWNGFHFDQVDNITFTRWDVRAQNDGVEINGAVGTGLKADIYMSHGKISNATVGLRLGGAFGGLYLDFANLIGNGQNYVQDTTLANEGNREVFIGSQVAIDSSSSTTKCGVEIADTLANVGGYTQFDGTWIASSAGPAQLCVDTNVQSIIHYNGGTIFQGNAANVGDGILNNSSTAKIFIGHTVIRGNIGWGLNSTVSNPNVISSNAVYFGNTSGAINTAFVAADQSTAPPSLAVKGTATFGGAARFSSQVSVPAATIAAAGTTLSTATAATNDINVITSATSGSATGVLVRAWSGTTGQVNRQEFMNTSGVAISLYPPTSSAQIWVNGSSAALAAGAPASLAVGAHATLECISNALCVLAP